MQRFFRRLAWRNLNIGSKIAVLFVVLMLLFALLVLVIQFGYSTARTQLSTGGTATVDMLALTQDLQLNLSELEREESRVVERRFGWGFFAVEGSPLQNQLRSDHEALLTNIDNDLIQFQVTLASFMTPTQQEPLLAQGRVIQSSATISRQNYDQILTLIQSLSSSDGVLAQLQSTGDEIQTQAEALNNPVLSAQVDAMRRLEGHLTQSVDTAELQSDLSDLRRAVATFNDVYSTTVPVPEQSTQFETLTDTYLQLADQAVQTMQQISSTYQSTLNALAEAHTAGDRLNALSEAERVSQLDQIDRAQQLAINIPVIGLGVILIVSMVLIFFFNRNLRREFTPLLQATRQIETGDLTVRVPVPGEDEFSRLGAGFNAMSEQIEDLVGGLENRVAERTRDLTITAEIGRAATVARDPRDLMNEVVELIRNRFGYYHAQVFLVDDEGQNAVLVASTGTAGRELLARRHALAVGSHSVIGQVTSRAEPIVALDTGLSGVIHQPNPLLPDTRSELALPMRIGDRVIGALDMQSVAPNAFDEGVVAVFQVMADQLALALENARLQNRLADLQTNVVNLERQIAAEAWDAYRQARQPESSLSYELAGEQVAPRAEGAPSPVSQAMESGQLVTLDDGNGDISLAVPIKVRGEVIGAFGFGGEGLDSLTDEETQLLEAIVARVGQALENLRLVEQTARRAEHEQVLNEITAKIVGSTDVNDILQTTVRELGRMLRAPQTSVQLRGEAAKGA